VSDEKDRRHVVVVDLAISSLMILAPRQAVTKMSEYRFTKLSGSGFA
jgi:hypothetical protein